MGEGKGWVNQKGSWKSVVSSNVGRPKSSEFAVGRFYVILYLRTKGE